MLTGDEASADTEERGGAARFTVRALLIAVVFFVGVAPTLSWLEFSSGSENLVVGTVLEMRRGGPWLIPTLKGEPRTSKPPLATWITAALVPPGEVAALSSAGPARDAAYERLAWHVRWPALAIGCSTLVAAAWLGRVIVSDAAGLATAAIMGSTLMFLRFARVETTDVHLALWATIANAVLVALLLRPRTRPWLGCIAAGLAIGLALMSKGPVALVETLAPIAVFLIWRRWRGSDFAIARIGWGPVIAGVIAAMAIALPWPVYVSTRMSGQVLTWYREVSRVGAIDEPADPAWVYLSLIPLLLPWSGFFVLGAVFLCQKKFGTARAVMLLAMVFVPIVVMVFFKDKNDRYLQPMLAPAALICAMGFLRLGDPADAGAERWRRGMGHFTFAALLLTVVGLAVAGATPLVQRLDGSAGWWSWKLAAASSVAGSVIVLMGWRIDPSGRRTLLPVAVITMIGAQALLMYGYAQSPRGRSDGRPVADLIVAALPGDAEVWLYAPPGRFQKSPVDVPIYLNRVVTRTESVSDIIAKGKRAAVMVHCREGQTVPPELGGWQEIGTAEKNRGVWHVLVSPG